MKQHKRIARTKRSKAKCPIQMGKKKQADERVWGYRREGVKESDEDKNTKPRLR